MTPAPASRDRYLTSLWRGTRGEEEGVADYRLIRPKHSHLKQNLYNKLKIGDLQQRPCDSGAQTTIHLLQLCTSHETLRRQIWADPTGVSWKLYGNLADLQGIATFKRAGSPL
ncbi:hypothetical protein ElyMa_002395200 [Elysia marginata]|uniref:Uncharacterized protein n=1 Tax=Elysia marginata TaxID=1093978 RepID=A0AAV4GEZ7_9GAST|nr:hypothetical protein ElyMa_002395200 [Elysia marginata]